MKYAVIAVALAFLPASSFAQEAAPALDGLWISRNAFGPDLVGEASLIREAELLRMNLAGVSALQEGRDLVMPNGRGRLHLGRMQSGRTLRAWWIQPEGLAGQSYMTPAIFHRDGAARWRGQVAPLMQSFTLYLSFTHNEQGRLVAAFRNPEFNMNGGASRLLVRVDGEEIVFSTTDGQERRRATWSSDSDRLRLSWPPLSAPIELRRATTEEAAAFYPRAPGSYAVQRPQSTDDGWRTARPGAVGIDEAALTALVQSVSDADPAALAAPQRQPLQLAALRLHELTVPTIAAVNGVAAGAGCNLALGCDLVVSLVGVTANLKQVEVWQRADAPRFGLGALGNPMVVANGKFDLGITTPTASAWRPPPSARRCRGCCCRASH